MFTPQEILERTDALEKAVFGGYSMESVEDLLIPLQEDYSELYKENAVLKSKLKVLVEKVEEYRAQEDSLKRAMVTAQKTADDMVAEAERKCSQMLSEAEQRMRRRSEELQKELAAEAEQVRADKERMQKEIAAEAEKVQKTKDGLWQEIQTERLQAQREMENIQQEIAAEQRRIDEAKADAARFITELEEMVALQLAQLQALKTKDLSVKTAPLPEEKPAPVAEASEEEAPVEEAPVEEAPAEEAPVEETPAVAEDAPAVEEDLSEEAMTRELEESISRILAGAMEHTTQTSKTDASGDTRVIKPF